MLITVHDDGDNDDVQVGAEQATKTIEGYVLAATVGEGGLIRAMKVHLKTLQLPLIAYVSVSVSYWF